MRLIDEGPAASDRSRRPPQKEIDKILGLFLCTFQLSQVSLGEVNQRAGLVYFKQTPDAAFLAGRDQFDGFLPGDEGFTNILDFSVILAQIKVAADATSAIKACKP